MTTSPIRPRLRLALLALSLSSAAFMGCGGTNSETPWPVEPEDVDLGPEGEARGNAQLGAPKPSGEPAAKPPTGEPAKPRTAPKEAAPASSAPRTEATPATQF